MLPVSVPMCLSVADWHAPPPWGQIVDVTPAQPTPTSSLVHAVGISSSEVALSMQPSNRWMGNMFGGETITYWNLWDYASHDELFVDGGAHVCCVAAACVCCVAPHRARICWQAARAPPPTALLPLLLAPLDCRVCAWCAPEYLSSCR